jgi:hypothetical protein
MIQKPTTGSIAANVGSGKSKLNGSHDARVHAFTGGQGSLLTPPSFAKSA